MRGTLTEEAGWINQFFLVAYFYLWIGYRKANAIVHCTLFDLLCASIDGAMACKDSELGVMLGGLFPFFSFLLPRKKAKNHYPPIQMLFFRLFGVPYIFHIMPYIWNAWDPI